MPSHNGNWPQSYGFVLYGDGPCYVLSVQRGSVAHKAGILPGDQLLEVDGHNVTDTSADAIATLARHSRTVPPTVGVTSRIQYVELIASRRWGFGFSLRGVKPTLVDSVDPPGPAYQAGIRPGDIVLEVNGHKVRQLELLTPLLSTRYGKVTLTVIPVETRNASRTTNSTRVEASRVRKARDLFAKMNMVLGSDYEKKMAVVGLLKQYAEDRNVDKFGRAVSVLLTTPQQARLIREISCLDSKQENKVCDNEVSSVQTVNDCRPLVFPNPGPSDRRPQHPSPSPSLPSSPSRSPDEVRLFPARIYHCRPFVPVKHRDQFDALVHQDSTYAAAPSTNASTSSGADLPNLSDSNTREVTIHRSRNGSFGFILRGHDPVYIESVNPGSAADRAGLTPGDAIFKLNGLDVSRSSHSHVVRLLQGSGSSPKLQIQHVYDEEGMPVYQTGSQSSDDSSASSHVSSSGWLGGDEDLARDQNGDSFRDKVDHLLTNKEKTSLRKALMNYNMHRNVAQLVDDLTTVLDAPSKRTLWTFLLSRMPRDHREYVIKYVDIPKHQLDLLDVNPSREQHQSTSPWSQRTADLDGVEEDVHHIGSFRQQLDYLLTSRERSQLKKALQIYAEKRNIQHLLEDLLDILDTPSKRTLWFYIIPLLSPPHQTYCQRRLGLPQHVIKTNVPGNQRPPRPNGFPTSPGRGQVSADRMAAGPRRGDVMYQQDDFNLVEKAAELLRREQWELSDDEAEAAELELAATGLSARERRSASTGGATVDALRRHHPDSGYLTRDVDGVGRKPGYLAHHVRRVRETSSQTTPQSSVRGHVTKDVLPVDYKTVVRVYDSSTGGADIVELNNPELSSLPLLEQVVSGNSPRIGSVRSASPSHDSSLNVSHNSNVLQISQRDSGSNGSLLELSGNRVGVISEPTNPTYKKYVKRTENLRERKERNIRGRARAISSSSDNSLHRVSVESHARSKTNGNVSNGTASDAESDASSAMINSVTSLDSYQTKAMKAIRVLDDVVADEQSELDFSAALESPTPGVPPAPPPPPPPPPPLPPPVPPPLPHTTNAQGTPQGRQMHVKRINWEKIEQVDDNMIWSKIGDGEDLADVVKYLELETQFSTKRNKISESFRERRNEICIMSPKKAYNISILLGHLKRGVSTVKMALYQMDEQVLTPELLRQMLKYAPDQKELAKFDSFKGSTNQFSKPDQFVYQLSRVPGYEERLRAMVFKANFSEKVDEVRHQLQTIKKASSELQSSLRLARILELVLAMGNYMNKGNQRIGRAAGFRISFLSQLSLTKTSDNKATFLHVLTDAVATKFPDALHLAEDLPTVPEAAKVTIAVSNDGIAQEIAELKRVLQDISDSISRLGTQNKPGKDKFHDVMSNFISQASDEIQVLFSLQLSTQETFKAMVVYFGENPTSVDPGELFSTFSNFLANFEKAHHHNLLYKRHYYKDGTSALGPSA